ncbi:MAG: hypothetical protein H5T74_00430 [Actinobacteria bacterium]|nr:hypothetical protein [Actinomycetota bacterium]
MRRWLLVFLVLAAAAVLVAGCGGGGETSAPQENGAPQGPVGQSEATACAANRNIISSAAQRYHAMEGSYPTSIQQLVPGYLQSVPACPAGGRYSLQGTTVTCSVHGS